MEGGRGGEGCCHFYIKHPKNDYLTMLLNCVQPQGLRNSAPQQNLKKST